MKIKHKWNWHGMWFPMMEYFPLLFGSEFQSELTKELNFKTKFLQFFFSQVNKKMPAIPGRDIKISDRTPHYIFAVARLIVVPLLHYFIIFHWGDILFHAVRKQTTFEFKILKFEFIDWFCLKCKKFQHYFVIFFFAPFFSQSKMTCLKRFQIFFWKFESLFNEWTMQI